MQEEDRALLCLCVVFPLIGAQRREGVTPPVDDASLPQQPRAPAGTPSSFGNLVTFSAYAESDSPRNDYTVCPLAFPAEGTDHGAPL